MHLDKIVNVLSHQIESDAYRSECREVLDQNGALVLKDFLTPQSIALIAEEGRSKRHKAFFCEQHHNVYLTPPDQNFPDDHPRNREIVSSKGCICDDDIAADSPLRTLYNDAGFQDFLCNVLGEEGLYEYADPLSSINLHYAEPGQELGWHFDNSSFAITLMIEPPEQGGSFDYVSDVRNSAQGDMNFSGVDDILNGKTDFTTMSLGAGSLAMFRGRDSLHRVAPVRGGTTRMLVVLAYNSNPGIALSESARMAFFGRLG